ncbi:MAG: RecQ family ATP-dependent DNA helicase [Saprospiraceae bacterium]|nr:RecQ family ATP-dependent DNA helicase [Saprospiraceae bacterium]
MHSHPQEILQRFWGFENFRSPQLEIISSILDKKDTIAILPTGAGKSLCYQVPALCLPNCTIVITPLIALMQNQVENLRKRNIFTDYIHSGLKNYELDRIIDNARASNLKILYVSPERFSQEKFLSQLQSLKIDFIAVDEAHCISQWGHDFRPSYLEIKNFRKNSSITFLAVTATATEEVKAEIIEYLELKNAQTFSLSSARSNLSLSVRKEENKIDQIRNVLFKFKNAGLIYSRNRRVTSEYADQLRTYGLKVEAYHAGMLPDSRSKVQKNWMENKVQYISCTTAFGMGIDKPDVDIVIHTELPVSLEEYYQEVGRAGRGGQKSYGLLLYNERDIKRLQKIFENSFPGIDYVQYIYKCLCHFLGVAESSIMESSVDFDIDKFCFQYKLNREICIAAIQLLAQSGWLISNSAFNIPSKVIITANEEALQNLYTRDPQSKNVIIAMLRQYEGILSVPTTISEKDIAFQCQLQEEQVVKILLKLHHEEIINYIPKREKPQILILNNRVRSNHITLDEKWIQQRKKILQHKIESMIQYVNTNECRQKFILQYFGEKSTHHCNICDNCLAAKKLKLPHTTKEKWTIEILELCYNNPGIYLRSLYQYFPSNKQHWVDEIIQELLGEEKLFRKFDKIFNTKPE